jgi:diacylglycerol kinase (ATP)
MPLPKKTVFIVNPRAGVGSTASKWPKIEILARDILGPFDTYTTTGPGDAGQCVVKAIASGARRIVSVGGDGTLNEVVNGLMSLGDFEKSRIHLGVLPNGTGCDFVKTAAIPKDIKKCLHLIEKDVAHPVDVGRLTFNDHAGVQKDCFFINVASFGLGGEVIRRVNQMPSFVGPFISFLWASLASILMLGKKRLRLIADNGFDRELDVLNVAIANGQFHGGGMWIAPKASLNDGLFHITIVGGLSLFGVIKNLPNLYNGKIYTVRQVISFTGKKVEATSDQNILLDIDGEQLGTLPVTIEIVPKALNMIIAKTG